MKTVTSNRPKIIYFFIVCAVLLSALLFSGSIYITPPWKITDPDNPKFDPLTFDFRDYANSKYNVFQQCDIVKKVFLREKMDRHLIDTILVTNNGFRMSERYMGHNTVGYLSPIESGTVFGHVYFPMFYGGFVIDVQYASDNNTIQYVDCIYLTGAFDAKFHRAPFFIRGEK